MKQLLLVAGGWIALALAAGGSQTLKADELRVNNPSLELGPDDRLISVLGTNDIHGGIEAGVARDGSPMGGLSFWSGVMSSIRQGVVARYGADRAGVLVVDAGDQFQGTLLSNFSEGMLMFGAMNAMAALDKGGAVVEAGYDAIIPGNHDYDFGPQGWLDDQVTEATQDKNPRGALERAARAASFPLLSANTYLLDSLVDRKGKPVRAENSGCKISAGVGAIDWAQARSPGFLKPYVIKVVAGVRVALIGIDSSSTPTTTTLANVSDLCFADEVSTYKRVRKEIGRNADLFVAIIHSGNTDSSSEVSKFVEKVGGTGAIDAVISGHTHWVTNTRVKGVPIVQSGSGGLKFGRVDLIYNVSTRKVDSQRTRSFGGIELVHGRCAPSAQEFCADTGGHVAYEGVPVVPNARIAALLESGRADIAQVAGQKLGLATALVRVDRTDESPLANALTDALRVIAGTEISFMNTGGIRAPVQPGDFTYEALFKVVPFNNHGLVIGPMGADKVVALLERSIKTCGAFGALMQSGLRVEFTRDCRNPKGQTDPSAALVSVRTLGGETIFDAASGGLQVASGRVFQVVTLDFLAAGGSGFGGFKGVPVIADIGIVREAMAHYYSSHPVILTDQVDGRWSVSLPRKPGSAELAPQILLRPVR